MACQYAKAMGIRIIAIDSGEEKRALTLELGAETYFDFVNSKDLVQDIKVATDDELGPHAVLLVAASEGPFQEATQVWYLEFSSLGQP